TEQLAANLASLRRQGIPDSYRADAEVYQKAAAWISRYDEFYGKDYAAWALDALDRGRLRAVLLARGDAPWLRETGHVVVRGYRSALDGSVQPYAVTFPPEYGRDPHRRWRLDVVLHGRDPSLNEVKFLHQHTDDHAAAKGQDWVQLDVFGRGNNAYRWAGQVDVAEAMEAFLATERTLRRAELIDRDRVVLRGFSMGGAGAWHIGLHFPDQWCVIGPGAGFTETHGYVKNLPDPLPPYQEACLHVYDAVDYAENAADVPVVAYDGADDPQLQAARSIEKKLEGTGIGITLLVAPGLKHQFPPEWQQKAEAAYAKYVAKGRDPHPPHVHFVTWTLKFPRCDWVDILALDEHYRRAVVDADVQEDGLRVRTANVRTLHLALPPTATAQKQSVLLDGQKLEAQPAQDRDGSLHLYFTRRRGSWAAVLPQVVKTERVRRLQKLSNLQGPIDDAFMGPFLCVRGTDKPWNEAAGRYAEAALKRFEHEWGKYLRGDLPVKDDTEVTAEDIAGKNLILFGDPASNGFIEQVLPGLPLRWTREEIALAGKKVGAADHVPVLIYPSPLNPERYVVLNSGHTFHAADFEGTNALLYPRLGDYALLKPAAKDGDPAAAEVVEAGLFDDAWQPGKK
ncbi:MAG TPA: prolyl oligopeptidase family serine peptidase, partial [Gemmataceae bacterium]|nr:prolyl oligopeptidase family serine peptidase [Gemmataceae bacterium]